MGFMDFLKKLAEKKAKELEKEPEKIAFKDVENWIKNKEKELELKEKDVFVLIKTKTSTTTNELKEKAKILEKVDYKSKKAEDRLKLIVEENLGNYLIHLKEFIEKLSNLENQNLEKVVDNTNKIFSDFDKKSYMNYQKATILIGKEIGNIKESTINLSKYLKKIFNQNSELINSSKKLNSIKSKLDEIDEIKKSAEKTNNEIKELEDKLIKINNKNKDFTQEIEKIKKRSNYIENLKKQEKVQINNEKIKKEIDELRKIIDFKVLSNIFHVVEEKNKIVKKHKEAFHENFHKDNGQSILNLINEARLNHEAISEKINQINNKKQEITEVKSTIQKDETEPLFLEIEKLKLENENIENEKEKQLKAHERIKTKHKEIIDLMKKDLNRLGAIVIDS